MTVELTVVISIAVPFWGAGIGVATFKRTTERDAGKWQSDGVFLTEIGYIKAGIDDIKESRTSRTNMYIKIAERLTAVEESAKQAHHRITRLEGTEK
jgi:hypothetical protein